MVIGKVDRSWLAAKAWRVRNARFLTSMPRAMEPMRDREADGTILLRSDAARNIKL
jgi:hypothetical protein